VSRAAPAAAVVERDGPSRLRLRGALTFATAAQVWARGQRELAACSGEPIEIDCSGIEVADSAALAVLVEWLAWGHRHGRSLQLQGLPQTLLDIARISEVDDLIRPE
jgi:phospholipid transport system transporter-binding protein